jgi:hypothetical protein
MEPVKAIVLTCDKYRALADHMIVKYAHLWPNHPFHFRVAYQESPPTMATDRVEYKKSPALIKATMLTLLDDLDDEELVYWCIDDKYPIRIDVTKIEKMYHWLASDRASAVSGILFCRCRMMLDNRHLTGQTIVDDLKHVYLERKGYEQIWIHQFLRVKVLRYLFESFPDVIPFAKYMDELKTQATKPPSHRIFVTRQNMAVFGESTHRGMMTRNCYRSMSENGLALPVWCSETMNKELVMGTFGDNVMWRLRHLVKRVIGRC